jgi:hypothetical protein
VNSISLHFGQFELMVTNAFLVYPLCGSLTLEWDARFGESSTFPRVERVVTLQYAFKLFYGK